MKTNRTQYLAFTLALFLIMQAHIIYGQDDKGYHDLDFRVEMIPDESVDSEGNRLSNLKLDIESSKIVNPKKIYLKVKSIEPREVYFIRSIDYDVVQGGVDLEAWEREKAALEKEREKERKDKIDMPGNRKYKELWTAKRYEKQEGRSLKKASVQVGDAEFEFGPFSPGDYEVFVGIKDDSSVMYLDTRKISIPSEAKQ
ncbi:MAG: hypothetical protein U9R49_14050 [Bacteroidota bacterium]|nr:hypothetical protein [Bacteroidota bacterium]